MLTLRSKESSEEKPVKGLLADQKPEIPLKPKKESPASAESNGAAQQNGKHSLEVSEESPNLKRPRSDDGDDLIEAKKVKVATASGSDDVVIVDDSTGGAIVIED